CGMPKTAPRKPADQGPVPGGRRHRGGSRSRPSCEARRALPSGATPPGTRLLHRMVATGDVLVDNFRPSVPARLGIDYPRLKAINPRLVYCGVVVAVGSVMLPRFQDRTPPAEGQHGLCLG